MVLAWTNLPAAFREAAERWQQRSGRTIVIEDKLDAGSAFIDPAYLADALAALLDNAADATPDGDTIRLSAACRERENGKVEARLSVVDDGVGMDPQDLQQAKELFYTTHDTNRRMGLGLPFVAGVVEAFSGRLELSSEPGRGFQATIVLECRRDARGDRPPSEKRAPGRVES